MNFKDCAVVTGDEEFKITGLLHKGEFSDIQLFDSKDNPIDSTTALELGWTKKEIRNGSVASSESSPQSPQTTDLGSIVRNSLTEDAS